MNLTDHGNDFGVEWVDVTIEPHHVEQFANQAVRIYEATIAPGIATQFHRHTHDTIYVVTAGGRFRSDEPGHHIPGTRVGRSTPLPRQLWWLATRKLAGGWVTMPTGTVIAQPHRTHPLIHRVIAHPTNAAAIRMLGIEPHRERPVSAPPASAPGIRIEFGGPPWPVYRLSTLSDHQPQQVTLAGGGVLVVVRGSAAAQRQGQVHHVEAGQACVLSPGPSTIESIESRGMDALLIPL
ncbi:MAG: hypothetical protein WCB92_16710 [Mycobacterium sp.]